MSKELITKQPEFSREASIYPKEGSYERIAWYLFESFLNDKLPEYVYDDLALATVDLMTPIRQYANIHLSIDRIKQLIDCEHLGKSIFALRLIWFCTNQELYEKLRQMFLDIKFPNENKWLLQKKKYLTTVLPYFKQYDNDSEIRQGMLNYFEGTRQEQVETTLRYFGGTDQWPGRFAEALNDKDRRSKHWVYIWCFNAICQEGRFTDTMKNQLKKIIEKYNRITDITDFEREIIEKALSA